MMDMNIVGRIGRLVVARPVQAGLIIDLRLHNRALTAKLSVRKKNFVVRAGQRNLPARGLMPAAIY